MDLAIDKKNKDYGLKRGFKHMNLTKHLTRYLITPIMLAASSACLPGYYSGLKSINKLLASHSYAHCFGKIHDILQDKPTEPWHIQGIIINEQDKTQIATIHPLHFNKIDHNTNYLTWSMAILSGIKYHDHLPPTANPKRTISMQDVQLMLECMNHVTPQLNSKLEPILASTAVADKDATLSTIVATKAHISYHSLKS